MGIAASCRTRTNDIKSVISVRTTGRRSSASFNEAEIAVQRLHAFYHCERDYVPEPLKPFYEEAMTGTNTTTTQMVIRLCKLGENGMHYLCKVLPFYGQLEKLVLWKAALTLPAIERLSSSLTTMQRLEILALEDNALKDDSVLCLSRSFKLLKSLKELWLGSNDITPGGTAMLAGSLNDLPNLVILNLDFNYVRGQGCNVLCNALISRRRLKVLSLRNNYIDSSASASLLTLGDSNPPVDLLDLQNNELTPTDCEALLKAFGDTVSVDGQKI